MENMWEKEPRKLTNVVLKYKTYSIKLAMLQFVYVAVISSKNSRYLAVSNTIINKVVLLLANSE
jgi:hypothetical protein